MQSPIVTKLLQMGITRSAETAVHRYSCIAGRLTPTWEIIPKEPWIIQGYTIELGTAHVF